MTAIDERWIFKWHSCDSLVRFHVADYNFAAWNVEAKREVVPGREQGESLGPRIFLMSLNRRIFEIPISNLKVYRARTHRPCHDETVRLSFACLDAQDNRVIAAAVAPSDWQWTTMFVFICGRFPRQLSYLLLSLSIPRFIADLSISHFFVESPRDVIRFSGNRDTTCESNYNRIHCVTVWFHKETSWNKQ